ncbi:hypothetical protein RFM68_15525 [Mesorhizobium sp. MSK_1335]|uniref:Uncharacterized protein n=1 Tax=Mesorhizobium montanum TaxID=3072323 RepID=A0ABU4ZKM8_9HYPH|nr:hypothetical protein [Mesorhizobium sp. MSK_1335]MDX8525917.1 hypothetical protein [Mesorhizobium sp. MSK_1335]
MFSFYEDMTAKALLVADAVRELGTEHCETGSAADRIGREMQDAAARLMDIGTQLRTSALTP